MSNTTTLKRTPKVNTENTEKKGSVNVNGVTIAWSDTRYMASSDPTGDLDLCGKYSVSISIHNGDLSDVRHALACANRLEQLSKHATIYCPVEGSKHALRLAGLGDGGEPLFQVIVGDRKADIVPASRMAQLDPKHYSNLGEAAMKTIAWMRAVGRITSSWATDDELHNVLYGVK